MDRPKLPFCCPPINYQTMVEAEPSIDSNAGLMAAFCAPCANMYPDWFRECDATLSNTVFAVSRCVRSERHQVRLAHLNAQLFERAGVKATPDYNLLGAVLFPSVLRTGIGVPTTLALLYKLLANRLNVPCWGVAMPGHMLCGTRHDVTSMEMLIDPINGNIVSYDEAKSVAANFGELPFSPARVEHRAWACRNLQNLIMVYEYSRDWNLVAGCIELEMVLYPGEIKLWRDAGLVYGRIGMQQPAKASLAYYLHHQPDTEIQEVYDAIK